MTATGTTREARPRNEAPAEPGGPLTGPMAILHGVLDRPLASYYLLLASVGMLVLIGMVMVFSATSVEEFAKNGNAFASVARQLLSGAVGLVAFWICQRLPARTFRALSGALLVFAFLLMAFVDALGFVSALRAAPKTTPLPIHLGPFYVDQLWLHIGTYQVQPAELAKLGLVLWGADVLTRKGEDIFSWRALAMPLFLVAGALFVMVGYNDLGSMICLLILFVGLLWAAGVRFRVFAAMFLVAVAGVAFLVMLPGKLGYRSERIEVFLDPSHADKTGPAYQYFHGLYAIANGGWLGVGLGEGRTKWGWLPNGHNDFIFAVIAEELGVIGCFVVLALFAVLAYTGLRIARRVSDPYRRLVAAGITTWFVGQATINIGCVVGLMPITGLPLPFISDGGSALVVALAAAGILTSFARAEPDASRALHARPPRRWVTLLWAPLPPLPRGERWDVTRQRAGRRAGSDTRASAGSRATARRQNNAGDWDDPDRYDD
jgi:cell division protein FtsW